MIISLTFDQWKAQPSITNSGQTSLAASQIPLSWWWVAVVDLSQPQIPEMELDTEITIYIFFYLFFHIVFLFLYWYLVCTLLKHKCLLLVGRNSCVLNMKQEGQILKFCSYSSISLKGHLSLIHCYTPYKKRINK